MTGKIVHPGNFEKFVNSLGSQLRKVGLAAMMFSLFQTLELNEINPRLWLTAYFQACAAHGGQVPAQPESFLPWNLTPEQRQAFRLDESDAPAASVDST